MMDRVLRGIAATLLLASLLTGAVFADEEQGTNTGDGSTTVVDENQNDNTPITDDGNTNDNEQGENGEEESASHGETVSAAAHWMFWNIAPGRERGEFMSCVAHGGTQDSCGAPSTDEGTGTETSGDSATGDTNEDVSDGPGRSDEAHGNSGEDHGKSDQDHGKSGEDHGKSGESHGRGGRD